MNRIQNHGTAQAFFFRDAYYLLPEGFDDAEAFVAWVRAQNAPISVQVVPLPENAGVCDPEIENGISIAPYFIKDFLKDAQPLLLDAPDLVFPVRVTLLTQKEYNARLRKIVCRVCPGCRNFGSVSEDDRSLNGHHDEVSLDGLCLYRRTETRYPRILRDELIRILPEDIPNLREQDGSVWGCLLEDTRVKFAKIVTEDLGDRLVVRCRLQRPSLLTTAVMAFAAQHYWRTCDGFIQIETENPVAMDADALGMTFSERNRKAVRAELKRHGVMLASLTYDPALETAVSNSVAILSEAEELLVLAHEPGQIRCLITNGAYALQAIRFHSPVFEKAKAELSVIRADADTQYRVSFDMEIRAQRDAPQPAFKRPTAKERKYRELEKKYVLTRDQVEDLFDVLEKELYFAPCNQTLKHTIDWLTSVATDEDWFAKAMEEIMGMGGFCDCEVLLNTYEEYEIGEDD